MNRRDFLRSMLASAAALPFLPPVMRRLAAAEPLPSIGPVQRPPYETWVASSHDVILGMFPRTILQIEANRLSEIRDINFACSSLRGRSSSGKCRFWLMRQNERCRFRNGRIMAMEPEQSITGIDTYWGSGRVNTKRSFIEMEVREGAVVRFVPSPDMFPRFGPSWEDSATPFIGIVGQSMDRVVASALVYGVTF